MNMDVKDDLAVFFRLLNRSLSILVFDIVYFRRNPFLLYFCVEYDEIR